MDGFNYRLKSARQKAGITQLQLAKATGSAQTTVSKYEHGEQVPTVDTLEKLASALGVSLDWLITGKEAA